MDSNLISQAELKDRLEYFPETGIFIWKTPRATVKPGAIAGSLDAQGYWKIHIRSRQYKAHRLAWLYMHGEWPLLIDHINGVRTDNRLSNLREVDRAKNSLNRKRDRDNRSGHKGVYWLADRHKWCARITIGGRLLWLGYFDEIDDAVKTVRAAREKYHGEYHNHGDRS